MKHFQLVRSYLPDRTLGELSLDGKVICNMFELPWLENTPNESCIHEGTYTVKPDDTGRHRHFRVHGAAGRSAIEWHEAYRVSELQGCQSPCYGFTDKYNPCRPDAALSDFKKLQGKEPFYLTIRARSSIDKPMISLNVSV